MKTILCVCLLFCTMACNDDKQSKSGEKSTKKDGENSNQPIIGKWQHFFPGGSKIDILFNEDSSTQVLSNGARGPSGKFYVVNDTLFIAEPADTKYFGRYLLNFYAPDSLAFVLIEDMYPGRADATPKLRLGRVAN